MAEATTTPQLRRPPKAAYKVINPVLGLILRSPLHKLVSGRLALLSYTGRRSGKRYTIPVGYVRETDKILLLSTQSGWKVNLRGGARVALRLQGHKHTGTAEVLDDESEMATAFTTMIRRVPDFSKIVGVSLDASGQARPADVTAVRQRGFVVVRIRLD